jgi:hypothetical protein
MLEDRLSPSSNILPTIHFPANNILAPEDILSVSGSMADPVGGSWVARIDYGDGTGQVSFPLPTGGQLNLNHTYARDGNYEVSVTVEDNLGDKLQATLNVHAQVLTGIPANTSHPVFPCGPLNLLGPLPPSQEIPQPQKSIGPLAFSDPGYLVEATSDNNTNVKTDPVAAQLAREYPGQNQPGQKTVNGNQTRSNTDTILLEKLQKPTANGIPVRPAAKKTVDGRPDLHYQPKTTNPFREIKPYQIKKNLQVLLRLQPVPLDRAQLAISLLERRGSANVLLAVLVMGWGMKLRKVPSVRWERNPNWSRKKRRYALEKTRPTRESRAAARAPPLL